VIWFHSWWGTPYYPILHSLPVLRQGEFGVHIFYVLSGFLITTLLLRERDRFGTISLRDFYIRRTLRIWPLYYATVLLYIFVIWKFEPDAERARNFFHYVPSFLTFTYTWFLSPQWPGGIFNMSSTLATEEQFYAFWPLIVKSLRGFWPPLVMCALICLPVAAYRGWFATWIPWDSFLNRVLINISIPIGFGAILAHALHYEIVFCVLHSIFGQRWMSALAAILLALCLAPLHPNFWLAWLATVVLIGTSVVREDHVLAPILQFRPLAHIGIVSYGMYLLNSLSIHLVQGVLFRLGVRNPAIIFPLGLALTVAVASISYKYYEKPFLSLKNKKFSRNAKERAPESSTDSVLLVPQKSE
jgi:peptidoglycan/LPS O-acetylase OafA/YrhL